MQHQRQLSVVNQVESGIVADAKTVQYDIPKNNRSIMFTHMYLEIWLFVTMFHVKSTIFDRFGLFLSCDHDLESRS